MGKYKTFKNFRDEDEEFEGGRGKDKKKLFDRRSERKKKDRDRFKNLDGGDD